MRMANAQGRKTATNLSVRTELVRRARELRLNLSEVFEEALTRAIAANERKQWLEANREAISEYNALVSERGVFSDDWRRF